MTMNSEAFCRACGHPDYFRWTCGDPHAEALRKEFLATRCHYCVSQDKRRGEETVVSNSAFRKTMAVWKTHYGKLSLADLEKERNDLASCVTELESKLQHASDPAMAQQFAGLRSEFVHCLTIIRPLLKDLRRKAYTDPSGKARGVRTRHDRLEDVLVELKALRTDMAKWFGSHPHQIKLEQPSGQMTNDRNREARQIPPLAPS